MARVAVTLVLAAVAFAWGAGPADAQAVRNFFEAEQLEYRLGGGADSLNWEAQGWLGGDYNKAWLKTQGASVTGGDVERAELQLLYSRTIAPSWDLQVGGRYDARPDPSRGYGVLGVQGLAPYFFEVDAAAFVSNEGDLSARLEAEYELLLTQRLIAKPSVELNFAVQEVRELEIGSGLSDVELGFRLRYEIVREVAPYIGVAWERKVGRTADLARRAGEEVDDVKLLVGVRFWF
ncbi:MAG: copper resistance protein B [Candidatus Rokubacteria bacterium]|nr:copper resistance protein B [Candidatus Rokubacteria bacterium]